MRSLPTSLTFGSRSADTGSHSPDEACIRLRGSALVESSEPRPMACLLVTQVARSDYLHGLW
ncbi:hypothetical protein BH23CHL6_BH23CHL6_00170 [soil metagenome]